MNSVNILLKSDLLIIFQEKSHLMMTPHLVSKNLQSYFLHIFLAFTLLSPISSRFLAFLLLTCLAMFQLALKIFSLNYLNCMVSGWLVLMVFLENVYFIDQLYSTRFGFFLGDHLMRRFFHFCLNIVQLHQ